VITSREVQEKKQDGPMISTGEGMKTDFSNEQFENDFSSIRISFDPLSNVNEESKRQSEKEFEPRISTDAGIQIERINDFHDEVAS
jgi:hypothetical protein